MVFPVPNGPINRIGGWSMVAPCSIFNTALCSSFNCKRSRLPGLKIQSGKKCTGTGHIELNYHFSYASSHIEFLL